MPENKHGAESAWQSHHGLLQFREPEPGVGPVCGNQLWRRQQRGGSATTLAAHVHEAQAYSYPREPLMQPAAVFIPPERFWKTDKEIVDNIFRIGA